MTTQEKEIKIQKVEIEIKRIEEKIAALCLQRENLTLRLQRLNEVEPHERKVPTTEEKQEQSRRDKERHQSNIQEMLLNMNFGDSE